MNSDGMKRRLLSLEKRRGARDVTLHFEDGSQRALRMRDPLGTLLTSFRRRSAVLQGQPVEPSKHDAALALFENAVSMEGDPLSELILSCTHQKPKTERKR